MTNNKQGKPSEKLSEPIPVRLWKEEKNQLQHYEASGLNVSEIVRRCIRRALPEVIREIREELGKPIESLRKENPAFQSKEERYRPVDDIAKIAAQKGIHEITKKTNS